MVANPYPLFEVTLKKPTKIFGVSIIRSEKDQSNANTLSPLWISIKYLSPDVPGGAYLVADTYSIESNKMVDYFKNTYPDVPVISISVYTEDDYIIPIYEIYIHKYDSSLPYISSLNKSLKPEDVYINTDGTIYGSNNLIGGYYPLSMQLYNFTELDVVLKEPQYLDSIIIYAASNITSSYSILVAYSNNLTETIPFTDQSVQSSPVDNSTIVSIPVRKDAKVNEVALRYTGGGSSTLQLNGILIIPASPENILAEATKSSNKESINVNLTDISPILSNDYIKPWEFAYIRPWDEYDVLSLLVDGQIWNDGLVVVAGCYDGSWVPDTDSIYDGKGVYDSLGLDCTLPKTLPTYEFGGIGPSHYYG